MKNFWKTSLVIVVFSIVMRPLMSMEAPIMPEVTIKNMTILPMAIAFNEQESCINPGEAIAVPTGQRLVIRIEGVSFIIGDEQLDSLLSDKWNATLQVVDTSTSFYRALSTQLADPIPVCKYVRLRLSYRRGDCFSDHSSGVIGTAELTKLISLLEAARGR